MADNIQFEIKSITKETSDTYTYLLKPLDIASKQFTYQAGQFLTLLLNINHKEIRRSYSFSSAPNVDELPAITIKRVPNGEASRYIHQYWKIGDTITALPPSGKFTPEPSIGPRDIFLVGAGSGITPLYSILKQTLHTEPESSIHLLYGNRNTESTIFHNGLNNIQAAYPDQLQIDYFFSESKYLDKARINKEVLANSILTSLRYASKDALFFICGPFELMQMSKIVIQAMGFDKNNIRLEIFETLEPVIKFELKDKTPKVVTLLFKNETYRITVPFNKTILDVALDNNIELPYSCRSGQCSTCATKCIQGKVVMHYNEVLTDHDEEMGSVLTCTGHPITDDVVLSYM